MEKQHLMNNSLIFFQTHDYPCSFQSTNPLDNFSNLLKKAGSLRNVFAPKRDRTFSDTSFKEDDRFNPFPKVDDSGVFPSHSQRDESSGVCYEAESPDEAALVYAAKAYGFILLSRTPDSVTVRLPSGRVLVFEVLDTLTFDSNRKRMSVLVRHPITKECVLYTKGADYSIMELLGAPYAGEDTLGGLNNQ